jgi:energy-coupling factor transport system permease protein
LFYLKNTPVHIEAFQTAGRFALRIEIILLAGTIFVKTTNDTDIARSFIYLIYPLKYIKVPIEAIAYTIMIALKFIPEYTSEAKEIIVANKLRQKNISTKNVFKKLAIYLSLFTPLFVLVFRKASNTYNALYISGFELKEKTKYKRYKFSKNDFIFIIFVLCLITFTILLSQGIIPNFLDY